MPRAALTRDDIVAFRQRATDAAMRLFAQRGYEAVTMRALAGALRVSAMTPYRYFEDKEALFAAVRAEAFRRFADRLEDALPGRGDAIARLMRLKHAYIAFALEQPDAYRIMFELSQPASHFATLSQMRRAFDPLLSSVIRAVGEGLIDGDPLTIAHLLWAGTHGLVSLHLAGKLKSGRTLAELAAMDHDLAPFRPRSRRTK